MKTIKPRINKELIEFKFEKEISKLIDNHLPKMSVSQLIGCLEIIKLKLYKIGT